MKRIRNFLEGKFNSSLISDALEEGWLEDFSNPYMVRVREELKKGVRDLKKLHLLGLKEAEEVENDPSNIDEDGSIIFPAVRGELCEIVLWRDFTGEIYTSDINDPLKGIVYSHPENSGPWLITDGGRSCGLPGEALWVFAPKASHIFK